MDTIEPADSSDLVSKQSLLLVDGDTRSLRVLEVSLRKAGFTVTPAVSVKDALEKLELHTPDLIISETKFPTDLDGFELRRRVRGNPDWAAIPFVFLTAETSIENKIRGLELGVDDYLTKPLYIKEIVTRINILLQKRQRANFEERKDGVRFAGRVADMPVVDVIQTIEVSRKSGVIQFTGPHDRNAAIYFRDGRVIDAEAGTLQGEDAVYRLLTWNEGEFEVEFRTVRRREAITTSSQGLLMEGMRRLDEWSRLLEQLPPLTHRFEVDALELSARLGEIPDDNNRILRLIDGKRSVLEVIDASDFGDLECLQAVARLYFEGLLIDLDPGQRQKRETGKPVPLIVVDNSPTPIEEVASGPIHLSDLRAHLDGNAEPQPIRPESTTEVDADAVIEEHAESEPADSDWTYTPRGTPTEPHDTIEHDPGLDPTPNPFAEPEVLPPLLGGFRPSSLRLIDEAVAAAQAIEPSLFEEPASAATSPAPIAAEPPTAPIDPAAVARLKLASRPSDPRVIAARDLVERAAPRAAEDPRDTNGASAVPTAIESDPSSDPTGASDMRRISTFTEEGDPTHPGPRKFAALVRREDSGLRMIGSHGRDRAEASGELTPPPIRISPPTLESAREMVTILPRRSTREIPAVVVEETPSSTTAPLPVHELEQASRDSPEPANTAIAAPPVEPAEPPPLEPTRRTGPGFGGGMFLVLASLLSGVTAYMYCHNRGGSHPVATTAGDDSSTRMVVAPDALLALAPADASAAAPADAARVVAQIVDAARPRPDATAIVQVPSDAAVVASVPHDAAERATRADAQSAEQASAPPDATPSRSEQVREIVARAKAALDNSDPDTALALADKALMIKHTVSALLIRARALQRLDRVDAALESIDQAVALDARDPSSWELKGRILWALRRRDEARVAFEKFLELDPNSKSAASIRHLLEEQR